MVEIRDPLGGETAAVGCVIFCFFGRTKAFEGNREDIQAHSLPAPNFLSRVLAVRTNKSSCEVKHLVDRSECECYFETLFVPGGANAIDTF